MQTGVPLIQRTALPREGDVNRAANTGGREGIIPRAEAGQHRLLARGRLSALGVLALAGCGSPYGQDAPRGAADAEAGSHVDSGAGDGRAPAPPVVAIACGSQTCGSGTVCCRIGSLLTCETACPMGSLTFACDDSNDCPAGKCCAELGTYGTTKCGSTCEHETCTSNDDCGPRTCEAAGSTLPGLRACQ